MPRSTNSVSEVRGDLGKAAGSSPRVRRFRSINWSGPGNDRTTYSRRNAINELEDRLLVWPTVLEGGVRALFVPAEIANAGAGGDLEVARPKPVSVVGSEPPYRPPGRWRGTCWSSCSACSGRSRRRISIPWPRRARTSAEINRMLWNRGSDRPPVGYLEMLVDFAVNLGLIQEPEDGSTQFERTAAMRDWRSQELGRADRADPEYLDELAGFWTEGQGRQDVEPWNVDWRGFRVKLLSHLAALDKDKWYRLTDVAQWISEYDPGIIGPDATVAVSQRTSPTGPQPPPGERRLSDRRRDPVDSGLARLRPVA